MAAPQISKPVLNVFRRIVRGYFRRHFHGVRISQAERLRALSVAAEPLIVYANHASWWDPMVAIFLAEIWMPGRLHFAPMDAEALKRYGILKHVGIFPVEMNTGRGAVQFLRTGENILSSGGVLWVTPQGKFVDSRVKPLQFKPGLAELAARIAARVGRCNVLPLAIEYPFWDERLPECLLYAGEVVRVVPGQTAGEIGAILLSALETAMEQLQQRAVCRDPALFQIMAPETVGPGGFYGLGRRLKSAIFHRPKHAAAPIVNHESAIREAQD